MTKRDFLTLHDLARDDIAWVLARARWLKRNRVETLRGKTLGLVLEKPSTRTRVSFEVGMAQLGGHALVLPQSESQMSRGEPIEDTARVLGRYLDAVVMRTHSHARITTFARHCPAPVINGLTETAHPAQLLADLLTVLERFSSLRERVVAFIGDGASNMALSWKEAAEIFGFELRLACPDGYGTATHSPRDAVRGADVVNTDVWTSMGQEQEAAARRAAFSGYMVDEGLMALAKPEAIVMHCLPAHRGEEISAAVLEGPQSAVWEQAENRMHAQKALLELLLLPERPEEL